MRRFSGIIVAAFVALALTSTAVAGNPGNGNGPPSSPPGQDECDRGNSDATCRPDPQPSHGADCDEHGNAGGINEDHCASPTLEVPTSEPSMTPSEAPSLAPSAAPSVTPSAPPSAEPTVSPTSATSSEPSVAPSPTFTPVNVAPTVTLPPTDAVAPDEPRDLLEDHGDNTLRAILLAGFFTWAWALANRRASHK